MASSTSWSRRPPFRATPTRIRRWSCCRSRWTRQWTSWSAARSPANSSARISSSTTSRRCVPSSLNGTLTCPTGKWGCILSQHDVTTGAAGRAGLPVPRSPVIGICAAYERTSWSIWSMDAAIVASTYLEHLAHEGALPLALIPSDATVEHADELVSRVDGLLLLGGADVDPAQYGADRHPDLEATVPLRDRSEIALTQAAVRRGIPVLGICRGLHLMNVATGGSLHQHIGVHAERTHRRAPGR